MVGIDYFVDSADDIGSTMPRIGATRPWNWITG